MGFLGHSQGQILTPGTVVCPDDGPASEPGEPFLFNAATRNWAMAINSAALSITEVAAGTADELNGHSFQLRDRSDEISSLQFGVGGDWVRGFIRFTMDEFSPVDPDEPLMSVYILGYFTAVIEWDPASVPRPPLSALHAGPE